MTPTLYQVAGSRKTAQNEITTQMLRIDKSGRQPRGESQRGVITMAFTPCNAGLSPGYASQK